MEYSLRVIRMYAALPEQQAVAQVLGKQALRSGTSAGAQQREADQARSRAEFISKMSSALQELSEPEYWLELLVKSGTLSLDRLNPLLAETGELKAIFISIVRKAKQGAKA
ncbi:MAG: four helix bundle protein [Lentisphaerota bacterium]